MSTVTYSVSILARPHWTGAPSTKRPPKKRWLFQSSPVRIGRALKGILARVATEPQFQSSPVRIGRALLMLLSLMFRRLRFNPRPSALDGRSLGAEQ